MTIKEVFIVNGNWQYRKMFEDEGWGITNSLEEADLVLFTGGEDVTPALYGERAHPKTFNSPRRDAHETALYKRAVDAGVPMAGICRGGQFLNVMNGGKMWQHVSNHAISGTHKAFVTGFIGEIDVTSTHHQMIIPNEEVEHIVLVTAKLSDRKESMGSEGVGIIARYIKKDSKEEDVESVYYPVTRSLSYQPHPEFDNGKGDCRDVFFFFINNYLLPDVDFDGVATTISNGILNQTHITEVLAK